MKKSILWPTQQMEFLGFTIDSKGMSVSLPTEKREIVQRACRELLLKPSASIRQVASIIGMLVDTFPGVKYGTLYYRCLEREREKTQALSACGGTLRES